MTRQVIYNVLFSIKYWESVPYARLKNRYFLNVAWYMVSTDDSCLVWTWEIKFAAARCFEQIISIFAAGISNGGWAATKNSSFSESAKGHRMQMFPCFSHQCRSLPAFGQMPWSWTLWNSYVLSAKISNIAFEIKLIYICARIILVHEFRLLQSILSRIRCKMYDK